MLLECNDRNNNGINRTASWSSSNRQSNTNESNRLSSSLSISNGYNRWRRTFSKLLKRTKSNKEKKGLIFFFKQICFLIYLSNI